MDSEPLLGREAESPAYLKALRQASHIHKARIASASWQTGALIYRYSSETNWFAIRAAAQKITA